MLKAPSSSSAEVETHAVLSVLPARALLASPWNPWQKEQGLLRGPGEKMYLSCPQTEEAVSPTQGDM